MDRRCVCVPVGGLLFVVYTFDSSVYLLQSYEGGYGPRALASAAVESVVFRPIDIGRFDGVAIVFTGDMMRIRNP